MQTFLPYPDFGMSAVVLDMRRLNKQITETKQILKALMGASAWRTHPATRMWRGYGMVLRRYGVICYREWQRRWDAGERGGTRDHKAGDWLLWLNTLDVPYPNPIRAEYDDPPWLGDPAVHAAYRAALLYKDPEWYGQFGWPELPAVPDDRAGCRISGRLPKRGVARAGPTWYTSRTNVARMGETRDTNRKRQRRRGGGRGGAFDRRFFIQRIRRSSRGI